MENLQDIHVIPATFLATTEEDIYKTSECSRRYLGQFYDQNGKIIDFPHHKRLIGTDLKSLRALNAIAVAGGEKKIDAIYGA
ncbi:sugar-binding domain-containing protein [Gottfriedia acidiceleris]